MTTQAQLTAEVVPAIEAPPSPPPKSRQGRVISWAIALALLAVVLSALDWRFVSGLDFGVLWEYRQGLALGLFTTFWITLAAMGLGCAIAFPCTVLLQSERRRARWPVRAHVEVWRNTPLIVQLYWVHFALPMVTGFTTTALQSGVICLTLQSSAYLIVLIDGGVRAVPRGQWDAAHALALPAYARWRHVIFPQALKIMLPPLATLAIQYFKGSAVLSVLAIGELTTIGNRIANVTFKPIEVLTFVAVLYFACTMIFTKAADVLEKRLARADR